MAILDFKELASSRQSAPPGEDFEALVREIGKRLGLSPTWSGRGSDQGRDLFFFEKQTGVISSREVRWLVSCKDFAKSGRSVAEKDVGAVSDKIVQHKAAGFILATTTTASTGLKSMLDGIGESLHLPIETRVWDKHDLEAILLRDEFVDLVKRFMPRSYEALQKLGTLPQTLRALEALVPESIYEKVEALIRAYNIDDQWLTTKQQKGFSKGASNSMPSMHFLKLSRSCSHRMLTNYA